MLQTVKNLNIAQMRGKINVFQLHAWINRSKIRQTSLSEGRTSYVGGRLSDSFFTLQLIAPMFFPESWILYIVKFNPLSRSMLYFSVIICQQLTFPALHKNGH